MSTRGIYGFRYQNKDKTSYNHFDSYPSGLGTLVLEFCQKHTTDEMKDLYANIKMVEEEAKPSKEEIETLNKINLPQYEAVDFIPGDGWYKALRGIQGSLDSLYDVYKEIGITFMTSSEDFIKDSLFCEYGYIINLDDEMVEFWRGFQRQPWEGNRYGTKDEDGFYPCRMLAAYPLSALYKMDDEVITEDLKNMEMVEELDEKAGGSDIEEQLGEIVKGVIS